MNPLDGYPWSGYEHVPEFKKKEAVQNQLRTKFHVEAAKKTGYIYEECFDAGFWPLFNEWYVKGKKRKGDATQPHFPQANAMFYPPEPKIETIANVFPEAIAKAVGPWDMSYLNSVKFGEPHNVPRFPRSQFPWMRKVFNPQRLYRLPKYGV